MPSNHTVVLISDPETAGPSADDRSAKRAQGFPIEVRPSTEKWRIFRDDAGLRKISVALAGHSADTPKR